MHCHRIRPKRSLNLPRFLLCHQRIPRQRQQQQQRQQFRRCNILFFSQTSYQDPTLAWAYANPSLAQECMNPPPFQRLGPWSENPMESLETYLAWRRWAFPDKTSKQPQGKDLGDWREHAKALTSHILSAPLTLASQFKKIIEPRANDNTQDGSLDLDWCCVGARAEASIPVAYWREFLIMSRASISSKEPLFDNDCSFSDSKSLDISIDFIGPDIPPKLSEQSVVLPSIQNAVSSPTTSLSLRGYHRGFFHDIRETRTSNPNDMLWDAYVFFNPGFGHPNLRTSWESTLGLLLNKPRERGHETPRALLLTAHSERDMTRDATILHDIYGLENLVYVENPFASRITYEDPLEKNHFVRPNHYVATVVI